MKSKKRLFIDTETTGLNCFKNDPWQISGIIEINGQVVEEIDLKFQPINWDNVSQEALDVCEITVKDLKSFMLPKLAYHKLIGILGGYINKYDKNDKFKAIGHNIGFDLDFLKNWFKKLDDPYFFSWVAPHAIDTLSIVRWLQAEDIIAPKDLKLESISNAVGIDEDIKYHDALEDIRVTREVYYKLNEFLKR